MTQPKAYPTSTTIDLGVLVKVVDPAAETAAKFRLALRNIVNALGPESICNCATDPECGLRDEAADALKTARKALGLDD